MVEGLKLAGAGGYAIEARALVIVTARNIRGAVGFLLVYLEIES
jgi:hypothetical protein